MKKTRNFSVYLLKEGYTAENTLKEMHSLKKAKINLEGAILYLHDTPLSDPWWKDYWGIKNNLEQSLKGAIVFLSAQERVFVLTFGHIYHNLKEESYEYDFGLITTLNALDPEKIKSSDILLPETAKRARIQSANASNLTFFDINKDESIFKKLTGAVKKEYKEILSNITGASSLRITSKLNSDEISSLCSDLLDIYNRQDYKTTFPDIQNIVPVKDPTIIANLNEKLLVAFHENAYDLVLTIPEIIDKDEITYSGAGKKSTNSYEDVYIAHYRSYITERNVKFDLDSFKNHKLNIEDENGNTRRSFSIYKCFLFDCELEPDHYHLCEGEWYKIEKNYINKIKKYLNPYFVEKYPNLIECSKKREDEYNLFIAENSPEYICLDKKNIAPTGQTAIEPCDLFTIQSGFAQLIHIKISTRSATLSHLFYQGLNSVELLRQNDKAKSKLKKLITQPDYHAPIDEGKFAVIYGIISAKKGSKPENLPIFSRISLMRTIKILKSMDVKCSVVFIKDNFDRKLNKDVNSLETSNE